MMEVEIETRVLGGLPVRVIANVYPAEPDVGIFSPQVEDMVIYTMRHAHAKWIEKQMDEDDWSTLAHEIAREYQYK